MPGLNSKWVHIGIGVLAGVILANKIRALPGGSHIPTV